MTENSVNLVDERLADMEKASQNIERANEVSKPKIQRVPALLRQNEEFVRYCTPKVISFGPIHHGNEDLKQGEQYKLHWTSEFLEEYRRETNYAGSKRDIAQFLHKRIEDNIEELKKLFTEDAIGSHDNKELAWMLFVDGCSLLYFMEKIDCEHPEALMLKFDQLMHIYRDIILLENQIHWKVLKLLCKDEFKLESLSVNFMNMSKESVSFGDGHDSWPQIFIKWISKVFRGIGTVAPPGDRHPSDEVGNAPVSDRDTSVPVLFEEHDPTHLLDYARSLIFSPPTNVNNDKGGHKDTAKKIENLRVVWQTYKNIRDLKAAGIRLIAYERGESEWSDISFTSKWIFGELKLTPFVFIDTTPYLWRNMIAFEACPDFRNNYECCSFIAFMDSLIDNADDVKELRSAGVIQNLLGSDEDLAIAFNELGNHLPTKMFNLYSTDLVAYSKKYIKVKQDIESHYRSKRKTWLAEFWNTHFKTPWTMLAFSGAVIALVLTFVQTWYSIPSKNA